MPLNKFNQSFTLKLKLSLARQAFILIPHGFIACILAVFWVLNEVTTVYFLVSLLCMSISLIYFVRLHLIGNLNKSIRTIQKSVNNNWSLTFKDGTEENVRIAGTSFSSNNLVIITFKNVAEKNHTVLITPDSIDQNLFRILKVLIKTTKRED